MIGNIAQFWRVTRELDVNAIRADFERKVTVRVLGANPAEAERVARLIDPDPTDSGIDAALLSDAAARDRRTPADAYVVVIDGPLDASGRRALAELSVGETPMVVAQVGAGADVLVVGVPEDRVVTLPADPDGARDRLLSTLLRAAPDQLLPLGRRNPGARAAIAQHLIRESAKVNAQFAALSSLPASIPLLGGLLGDAADMLVLTKNQVVLLFKLAGLYGRDLTLGPRLLGEVAPVVGSAFLWRSTARSLVGLLPTLVSVVPKVVIAYSGTFVVGEMARYYYEHGRKPPADLVKELSAEGMRLARTLLPAQGGKQPNRSGSTSEAAPPSPRDPSGS